MSINISQAYHLPWFRADEKLLASDLNQVGFPRRVWKLSTFAVDKESGKFRHFARNLIPRSGNRKPAPNRPRFTLTALYQTRLRSFSRNITIIFYLWYLPAGRFWMVASFSEPGIAERRATSPCGLLQ
jgi:hypothetical protein